MTDLTTLRERKTDALTGLPSLPLRDVVEAAVGLCEPDRGLLVLHLNIHGMKEINQRFGHPEGDAVVRECARRLRAGVGRSGVAGRLGGDQFMVVLPLRDDGPNADAQIAALRAALAEPRYALPSGQTLDLTASVGRATVRAGAQADQVDEALYHSQRADRRAQRRSRPL